MEPEPEPGAAPGRSGAGSGRCPEQPRGRKGGAGPGRARAPGAQRPARGSAGGAPRGAPGAERREEEEEEEGEGEGALPCPALARPPSRRCRRGARHGSEPGAEQCPCGTGQVPWHRAQNGSGAAGLCQRLCQRPCLLQTLAQTQSSHERFCKRSQKLSGAGITPLGELGARTPSARHRDALSCRLPADSPAPALLPPPERFWGSHGWGSPGLRQEPPRAPSARGWG